MYRKYKGLTLGEQSYTIITGTNIQKVQMKLITTNSIRQYGFFYPELSYTTVGILLNTHNELGPYAREKQYGDKIEEKLREIGLFYEREVKISDSGNIADFILDRKIILELKTERFITKEHYFQVQRYLQATNLNLGILVNFRNKYIKPIRIVKINNYKF